MHSRLLFFFFNDTATTEIYTLSLHDALPISSSAPRRPRLRRARFVEAVLRIHPRPGGSRCPNGARKLLGVARPMQAVCRQSQDRKSTRLNSSHGYISYAVFCLKKKNNQARAAAPATLLERGITLARCFSGTVARLPPGVLCSLARGHLVRMHLTRVRLSPCHRQ